MLHELSVSILVFSLWTRTKDLHIRLIGSDINKSTFIEMKTWPRPEVWWPRQTKSTASQDHFKAKSRSRPSQNQVKIKTKSRPSQDQVKIKTKSRSRPSQDQYQVKIKAKTSPGVKIVLDSTGHYVLHGFQNHWIGALLRSLRSRREETENHRQQLPPMGKHILGEKAFKRRSGKIFVNKFRESKWVKSKQVSRQKRKCTSSTVHIPGKSIQKQ